MTPIKTPFGGTLEFYPLPDTSSKGTVLICPGGGYSFLAEREGKPIADAFNQNGYSAAILNYCLDRDVHGTNPVKELAWAARYLRTASEWNGLGHKLWVSGFSAGGHLAASLGTLWNEDKLFTEEEQALNKPDGLILGYRSSPWGLTATSVPANVSQEMTQNFLHCSHWKSVISPRFLRYSYGTP